MKKLFIFGDSWAFGAELAENEKSYGELLGKRFQIPWHNFAVPSTSIPHLILQLKKAKEYCEIPEHDWELSETTALFFLTSPHRDLIWREGRDKELHLNPTRSDDVDVKWYTEWHTQELATYRVNTTLLALHYLCQSYGFDDRYVWGWDRINLWPEVNLEKFWQAGTSTVLDLFDDLGPPESLISYVNQRPNRYIWPNGGHPNQVGHQRIADALADWLSHNS